MTNAITPEAGYKWIGTTCAERLNLIDSGLLFLKQTQAECQVCNSEQATYDILESDLPADTLKKTVLL